METDKKNSIHPKELGAAKFWVTRELEGKHLPFLPERVEERLFFEGRTAWNYKYSDLNVIQTKRSKKITFSISALLKKEFHGFIEQYRFKFNTTSLYDPATHKLKVLEIKIVER